MQGGTLGTSDNCELAKLYRVEVFAELLSKSGQITIDLVSRSKEFDVGLVVAGPETALPFCASFATAYHLRRFQT